jgi:hypothetical protein
MHDLVAGKVGSLSTWAGWLHGAVAFDANGNGTISGVAKSDGSTTSVAAVSYSISPNGEITVSGSDIHGFMSADKRSFVQTMTDGGGGCSLFVGLKEVPGTIYNTADLQGSWQMNDLVAGKVGSLSTWAGWLHGVAAFDASGNATISGMVKSDGSTTSVSSIP